MEASIIYKSTKFICR